MLNIKSRLIENSEMSRTKENIREIYKIVLHHAPLKNKSAIKNRNYINNLKYQDEKFCSYHYIIDFNGEIINIIPENELALHTKILEFDYHSIGIAICYKDDYLDRIPQIVQNSLKELSFYLLKKYNLDRHYDLIRCYDLINKRSPVFFVDNQYNFLDFKYNL